MTANVGIAERADRLVVVLVGHRAGTGCGVPYVQAVGLWLLAVASVVTVVQRMLRGPPAGASTARAGEPGEPASGLREEPVTDGRTRRLVGRCAGCPSRWRRPLSPGGRRPGLDPTRARACASWSATWPGSVPGRRARSDCAELSRAGMRSYLRYWSEVFRLPD